ncbi:MAG: methyltransferase domain-containing protein [Nanoarchaeota archaeon]|nr:methyltransferase domain-containing protein [Nanoarchaeota archaeon]
MAKKHTQEHNLFFEKEDLRWATPEIVAGYRAERLQCDTIVDLGCGIGFQTLAFAKKCKKVYAVEIDKRKIEHAARNAQVLGLANIEFIHGDMLDPAVVQKITKANIIFCDPERLPEEEERTLQSIIPDVHTIIETYTQLTPNIAIEFPPQIKSIPFECEKEYLSLHGNLNRLTLYFGTLKMSERSAVVLPQNKKIGNNSLAKLSETKTMGKYLLEVDPAVVKAGLLAELSAITKTSLYAVEKAVFFTADISTKNPFFKHSFDICGQAKTEQEVILLLQKYAIGKVLLRYAVHPQEYWTIRNRIEQKLSGDTKASLFKFGDVFIVGMN